MTACPTDSGSDGGNGDDSGITGGTIAKGAPVTYLVEAAKSAANFSFVDRGYGTNPLSDYLDGTSNVTITNGKVSIILDVPKAADMQSPGLIIGPISGVTAAPSNAKAFYIEAFYTEDSKYCLSCNKDTNNWTFSLDNLIIPCFVCFG